MLPAIGHQDAVPDLASLPAAAPEQVAVAHDGAADPCAEGHEHDVAFAGRGADPDLGKKGGVRVVFQDDGGARQAQGLREQVADRDISPTFQVRSDADDAAADVQQAGRADADPGDGVYGEAGLFEGRICQLSHTEGHSRRVVVCAKALALHLLARLAVFVRSAQKLAVAVHDADRDGRTADVHTEEQALGAVGAAAARRGRGTCWVTHRAGLPRRRRAR
mmetsp:Transcript_47248/g.137508  ORF Transcript_47248/g.137508 Transcript_47248/m.137508 type:complete len:220 (+) Transcript_47248:463-1122(+)